jgi:hypothetical protein
LVSRRPFLKVSLGLIVKSGHERMINIASAITAVNASLKSPVEIPLSVILRKWNAVHRKRNIRRLPSTKSGSIIGTRVPIADLLTLFASYSWPSQNLRAIGKAGSTTAAIAGTKSNTIVGREI